jgi:hypothetical protein
MDPIRFLSYVSGSAHVALFSTAPTESYGTGPTAAVFRIAQKAPKGYMQKRMLQI